MDKTVFMRIFGRIDVARCTFRGPNSDSCLWRREVEVSWPRKHSLVQELRRGSVFHQQVITRNALSLNTRALHTFVCLLPCPPHQWKCVRKQLRGPVSLIYDYCWARNSLCLCLILLHRLTPVVFIILLVVLLLLLCSSVILFLNRFIIWNLHSALKVVGSTCLH